MWQKCRIKLSRDTAKYDKSLRAHVCVRACVCVYACVKGEKMNTRVLGE